MAVIFSSKVATNNFKVMGSLVVIVKTIKFGFMMTQPSVIACLWLNPLPAKFFRGNINIYLHFVSFLHIDTMQVVEILPQVKQESTYST